MKCTKCGSEIKDGQLFCDVCGEEVRIVPDFDVTIDDKLKLSLTGVLDDINDSVLNSNADTKEIKVDDVSVTKEIVKPQSSKNKTEDLTEQSKPANMKQIIAIVGAGLVAVLCISFIFYGISRYNSYDVQYEKAFEQYENGQYEDSVKTLKHVVKLNNDEAGPRLLLCDNYYELKKYDEALAVLEALMEKYPSDMNIYERLVKNYEAKGDNESISKLVTHSSDESVKYMYEDFIKPVLKITPDSGEYAESQFIELVADSEANIYYTIDGSDPTDASLVYSGPILLEDGEIAVKAICINGKGVASDIVSAEYKVEFEIPDAPVITPTAGQFTEPTEISVEVPEGLKCFYTIDGLEPTEDDILYDGPFAMYIGKHDYKFACIDEKGNTSEIVDLEYTLDIVNFVSMGAAVTNLQLLLDASGHHVEDYLLKCEQATIIDGSTYYVINEYEEKDVKKPDSDLMVKVEEKNGLIYAVNVLTGLTFKANLDKTTGKYALSAW